MYTMSMTASFLQSLYSFHAFLILLSTVQKVCMQLESSSGLENSDTNNNCNGKACLGREQCFDRECSCVPPFFHWKNKNGQAASYPCYHELCGAENISIRNFTELVKKLTYNRFEQVNALRGYDYCMYGRCHTTVNKTGATEYHCKCDKNVFVGDRCEYTWDICSSEPCLNGGTCSAQTDTIGDYKFTCTCVFPYEGALCHRVRDECQVQPCENGGLCLNFHPGYGNQFFLCLCSPGYDGSRCEDDRRRRSTDEVQIAVISATMFLITSLLVCCATTSHFRQKQEDIWGVHKQNITEIKPVLLERLYKIKDAINRLEESGGLRAFYEQMEMMRPGGGRIQIDGGGGKKKKSDNHISSVKGAMAFFNKFSRSKGSEGVPAKTGKTKKGSKTSAKKKIKKKGSRKVSNVSSGLKRKVSTVSSAQGNGKKRRSTTK